MERIELYNKITPCGNLDYLSMVWLINNIVYQDQQIGFYLLSKLGQTGKLSQQDWITLIKSSTFISGSPIDENIALSWLVGKCNLNRSELMLFLEYIELHETEPTFLTTGTGNLITTNNY